MDNKLELVLVALGIVAIALIGALYYWLIKVRPVYQSLKRAIRKKVEAVRENNADLEQADILFRVHREVKRIRYVPPEMTSRAKELSGLIAKGIEELSKRTFPSVEDTEWFQKHDQLYEVGEREPGFWGFPQQLADYVTHWLWRGLRAPIVFNRDKILATLFPGPRGSLAKLRELDEGWAKLVDDQRELLKLLLKLPGSAEFLDAKEKARLEKKAERERSQQAIASIEQAKERLGQAIKYIRLRHSEKSLEIGELPVTGGAANLTLSMLEQYWEMEMGKVNDMIQRAVDPAKILGYITGLLLPNLEGRFEEKAKVVAKAEFIAGEIRGRLSQLKEERGMEINIPKALKEALAALESKIPPLWAKANWQELDTALEQIGEAFEDGREYLNDSEALLEAIDSVDVRIKAVQAKEKRLKEDHDFEVPASAKWTNALEMFNSKALKFWAAGAHDRLELLLEAVEVPLKQHSTKVSNRLSEADREAETIPTAESDFESRLADIAAATEPSNGSGIRRRQSATDEPKQQTGKLVPYTAKTGITVQIDESLVEVYRSMDATPDSD